MTHVALVTDHSSHEGSRELLAEAIRSVTGQDPTALDARYFVDDGGGSVSHADGVWQVTVPPQNRTVIADAVIVYEIPPETRRRFEGFQCSLAAACRWHPDGDAKAWRDATEKDRTATVFARHSIGHMPTIVLSSPTADAALVAFHRLGSDVWAKPTVGAGGRDVFHLTDPDAVTRAVRHYRQVGCTWLMSQDAGNFDASGRRHQYRVIVLGDRVLRVCEHVQSNLSAPCNEAQGAVSTVLRSTDLPPEMSALAIDATRALGLQFGGVDLVVEKGGVVFEVNVHPVLNVEGGLDQVAVPLVEYCVAAADLPSPAWLVSPGSVSLGERCSLVGT